MAFQKGNKYGKGAKPSNATLAQRKMREWLMKHLEKDMPELYQAQLSLAKGYQILLARQFETDTKTGRKSRTGKWVMITDPEEALQLLNGNQKDIFKMVTTEPDPKASSYLMSQAVGAPTQTVEMPALADSLVEIISRMDAE